jgi:Magnesium chelatase, subunit ChlI
MLVAAMNPCRCGRASEPGFTCNRRPNTRCAADYQTRISGPLIDRIDLHIEVPAVTAADLILPPPAEGSREIAERVALARERQVARYAAIGLPHVRSNAAVSSAVLEDVARPDASGMSCCATPPTPCGSRPAAIIACCGWRARWPISMARKKSAACISLKRCPTARSRMRSDARRN